jgi:hypothetical protein
VNWYCPGCLEKQQKINRLEEEIARLKAKLRYQERTASEGPFGSSTPSSKIPIKPSSLPERQARKGGAKAGHVGHGRKRAAADQADHVERVSAPDSPDCGEIMELQDVRERTVQEAQPVQVKTIVYQLERKQCPHCGKKVQVRAPGVLPKCEFGNGLLTHVAVQHYLYGTTLGQLERQTGLGYGSLVKAMHQLARRMEGIIPGLIQEYRRAHVKHADETGWRNDGANGYAWLFCTKDLSLFRFRSTRSAKVVQEVLGTKRLPGTLVVDRYGGYNKAPCKIQYCYSHLLRDVEDVEKNFPDQPEVRCFVATVAPLLSAAMGLRGLGLSKREFLRQAKPLVAKIVQAMNRPAEPPAIRHIQDIFREKKPRLYHWAKDPAVPADNNFAERELRPLVVARKVSFGSQSENGAHTREVLMSVLHTLRKRTADPYKAFRELLDTLAADPDANVATLLPARHPP